MARVLFQQLVSSASLAEHLAQTWETALRSMNDFNVMCEISTLLQVFHPTPGIGSNQDEAQRTVPV